MVVQTLDSAIHRINHYPADKYLGNQLLYPLDRFLSGHSAIERLNNRGQLFTEVEVASGNYPPLATDTEVYILRQ